MKNKIKKMLNELVGEESAEDIMSLNFPKPIKGYSKGKILTFKQLKELSEGTIIHVHYTDEDGSLRTNDFHKLTKYSEDEFGTEDGFPLPIDNKIDDNTLIDGFDNCGWTFTLSEAIKKVKVKRL